MNPDSLAPYNALVTHAAPRACVGLLAGVLALSSAGCTQQSPETTAPNFFPLHADDTWVYDVVRPMRNERTRMTARVRGERYIPSLGRRCRLVDETYSASEEAFGALDAPSTGRPEVYPIAYCRLNGFLSRALSLEYHGNEVRDVGLGSAEERFLPDGFGNHLAWDSVTTAYDLGGGTGYGVQQTHWIVPEPAIVEVPAGRFVGCMRVETVALHAGRHDGAYDGEPVVLYYSDWYAPNVGLIRTLQSNRPGGGPPMSQIELVAYDVEGAPH